MNQLTASFLLVLLLSIGANAATLQTVPNVAAMQALGTLSAEANVVYAVDYSRPGDGGGGIFVREANSAKPNNSCTIFSANGSTGKWIRQISDSRLDYRMCGAISDNATDATAALQAAEYIAAREGYEIVCKGNYRVNSNGMPIIMGIGVKHIGSGPGQCNLTQAFILGKNLISVSASGATLRGNAVLHLSSTKGVKNGMKITNLTSNTVDAAAEVVSYTDTTVTMNIPATESGVRTGDNLVFAPWMFRLQNPKGLASVEAPKFFDMTLTCGACVQYNSPTGGFTDDATSQMPFINVQIERVQIHPMDGNTGQAIQISKANFGSLRDIVNNDGGFDTGIDLEGADSIKADNVALSGAYRQHWLLRAHGTFGNEFLLTHGTVTMLNASHCVASITDSYRSSTIENTYFENGPIGSCPEIALAGGFHAIVRENNISQTEGSVINWITVADDNDGYKSIDISDNYNGAALKASVLFNGGRGVQAIKSGGSVVMSIKHSGNFSERGFPPSR
jgi:hypothetical protein